MRESSCFSWGWNGFSDEKATQYRADRGPALAGSYGSWEGLDRARCMPMAGYQPADGLPLADRAPPRRVGRGGLSVTTASIQLSTLSAEVCGRGGQTRPGRCSLLQRSEKAISRSILLCGLCTSEIPARCPFRDNRVGIPQGQGGIAEWKTVDRSRANRNAARGRERAGSWNAKSIRINTHGQRSGKAVVVEQANVDRL